MGSKSKRGLFDGATAYKVEIVVRKDRNRDRISQASEREAAAPLRIACRVNDEAKA